ncbi:MAG: hypothetical protein RLZZ106_131 [Cyanobacteriota bacterium]
MLAWVEDRPDLGEPLVVDPDDPHQLTRPYACGTPVKLPGDTTTYHLKLRLWSAVPRTWLPLQPELGIHLSTVNPIADVLWDDDNRVRRLLVRSAATLRYAAAGDAEALAAILNANDLPAAAQLVLDHADGDGAYELAAGSTVTKEMPSPRRLLLACAHSERDYLMLDEIADGALAWDSGPAAIEVPRNVARLPGKAPSAAETAAWMARC